MAVIAILVAALLISVSITAFYVVNDGADENDDGTGAVEELIVGTTNIVSNINIADYYFGVMAGQLTHQSLIKMNSTTGSFEGCLADSWYTLDSKVWVFNITSDAEWSDGYPVTAEDVEFSFEYRSEHIPGYSTSYSMVENVDVQNGNQVVITLNIVDSNFLTTLLVLRAIPQHIFENVTDPATYNDKNATIGCGPYIFDYFDSSSGEVSFVANENYRDGAPNVGRITYVMYKNQDAMVMALKIGEIDATYIYASGISYYYVAGLVNYDDIEVETFDYIGVPMVLWFNEEITPYNNQSFREAVSYCINYNEVLNLMAAGYGSVPNAGFVPTGTYGYIDTRTLSQNLTLAAQILDEAGFLDVDNDGYRENVDGSELTIELLTRTDLSTYSQLAQLVKGYMGKIGLNVEVSVIDRTTFGTIMDETKEFEMAITGTTPWGMMSYAGYGSTYIDDRSYGWTGTADENYTNLVDQLMAATTSTEMLDLAAQIQEYYASELPVIALYWGCIIQPHNVDYTGFSVDALYGIMSYETFYNLADSG